MVGPAAKRQAVAHLRSVLEMSERRACTIVAADRKMIRYRSRRPPDIELRARLRDLAQSSAGGGDFYRTTLSRVSRRFARALVESTLEGQTLYRDAFRMLGVKKTETFNNIGREVGVRG